MAGGYFHYESDSSVPSSSDDRSLACSPATSLMNHPIGHAGARGASLDLSPSSTRSGGGSGGAGMMMRDPFVDPRLSLDSWSRSSSIESSNNNAHYEATPSLRTNGESDYHYRDSSDQSERPRSGPGMCRSNSDVQRELQDAIQGGLPTPKEEKSTSGSGFASRKIMLARGESKKSSTTSSSSTHSGSTSGGGGLLSQFRTGSGWFAPVVPPEPKLTRAEREQLEKERIEELRNSGANASRKRPSFMKRVSSGVEMMGSFGKDSSGLSPAKQGRARSGTATTITEAYRG